MDDRARNWVFIAYPEHHTEQELDDFLDSLHIQAFRSPLHHGYDFNGVDERKDHWHIGLIFQGKKSYEQIMELVVRPLKSARPEVMLSIRGSARYFLHKDNPEKEQFYGQQIKTFGGFDIESHFCPTSSEKSKYIGEMEDWIEAEGIQEFDDLSREAKLNHFDTWYWLLNNGCANRMEIKLRSIRNRKKDSEDINKILSAKIEVERRQNDSLRQRIIELEKALKGV